MLVGRRIERLLEPRVLGEACRVVASEDHLDEVGSLGYHNSVSGGMGEKDETEHILRARFLMCERGTDPLL
jgi:hypothetical protein